MATRKKAEVWTKRCSDGRACAPIDYDAFKALGKRAQKAVVKENYKGFRFLNRTNFVPDDYDICDSCLESLYDLEATYDALDHLGLLKLYEADGVLRALRQARVHQPERGE